MRAAAAAAAAMAAFGTICAHSSVGKYQRTITQVQIDWANSNGFAGRPEDASPQLHRRAPDWMCPRAFVALPKPTPDDVLLHKCDVMWSK